MYACRRRSCGMRTPATASTATCGPIIGRTRHVMRGGGQSSGSVASWGPPDAPSGIDTKGAHSKKAIGARVTSRALWHALPVVSRRSALRAHREEADPPWGEFLVAIEPLWKPLVWFLRRRDGTRRRRDAHPPTSRPAIEATAFGSLLLGRSRASSDSRDGSHLDIQQSAHNVSYVK